MNQLSRLLVFGVSVSLSTAIVAHDGNLHEEPSVAAPEHLTEIERVLRVEGAKFEPPYKTNYADPKDAASIRNNTLTSEQISNYQANQPLLAFAVPDSRPGSSIGRWSDVGGWDVVAIHANLLPTGKVLIWDATPDDFDDNGSTNDVFKTRVRLFDPISKTVQNTNYDQADLFCAGSAHLWDGRIIFTGGDLGPNATNASRFDTTMYNPYDNTWRKLADMIAPRWYAGVAALPNGELLTLGGTNLGRTVTMPESLGLEDNLLLPTHALYSEVFQFNKTWRGLDNVVPPYGDDTTGEYQWMQTRPDGKVAVMGPHAGIASLTTEGQGNYGTVAIRDEIYRGYGSYALYEEGKVLISGGGPPVGEAPAINSAVIFDMVTNEVTATSPMQFPRRQHYLTVLADGSVLASGGIKGENYLVDSNEANHIKTPEIFRDGQWFEMADMQMARQYHSVALLLPDGSVLVGGTGYCGECFNEGIADSYDYEIFYPPYLFKPGTSERYSDSERPQVTNIPEQIDYEQPFLVDLDFAGSDVTAAYLIKLGSATHSHNQDQRLVNLDYAANGNGLFLNLVNQRTNDTARNVAPPGHYMLFILNGEGTPSFGKIIKVGQPLLESDNRVIDTLLQDNSWNYYEISPVGSSTIEIDLINLSDDADVFVEAGTYPNEQSPTNFVNGIANESLVFSGDGTTPWYIGVRGSINATYTLDVRLNNSGENNTDHDVISAIPTEPEPTVPSEPAEPTPPSTPEGGGALAGIVGQYAIDLHGVVLQAINDTDACKIIDPRGVQRVSVVPSLIETYNLLYTAWDGITECESMLVVPPASSGPSTPGDTSSLAGITGQFALDQDGIVLQAASNTVACKVTDPREVQTVSDNASLRGTYNLLLNAWDEFTVCKDISVATTTNLEE